MALTFLINWLISGGVQLRSTCLFWGLCHDCCRWAAATSGDPLARTGSFEVLDR